MLRRTLRAIKRRIVKPAYVSFRLAIAKSVLHMEFYGEHIGFFAQLAAILKILRHAEEKGFVPIVRLTSPNYLDPAHGNDWFAYFFRLKTPDPAPGPYLRIFDSREMPNFRRDLSMREAQRVFFKYVELRPEIAEALGRFCAEHAIGPNTLGVHYRGTDKVEEAAPPSFDAAFAVIAKILALHPAITSLYVASDEQAFISRVATLFPNLKLVTYDDSVRSQDGRPIHLGGRAPGNYLLGRDALMNALILSRCSTLVRSTSFLSAWSSIFNPELNVVLLNTPYREKLWYPEREIMRTALLAQEL